MHCMRMMAGLLILAVCGTAAGWSEEVADPQLKHFTKVDTAVFAGSKPTRDADFEFLKAQGVKYILQVNFLPGLTGKERKQAAKVRDRVSFRAHECIADFAISKAFG